MTFWFWTKVIWILIKINYIYILALIIFYFLIVTLFVGTGFRSFLCVLVWRLVQKGDLHVGALQWTVAAADLVYTNELRYEMASPLLSRWFVRRRRNSSRNEMSPLFIFFSTWNYDYAPYQVKQMLTRAREDPWWKLYTASCNKKMYSCITRICRLTVTTVPTFKLANCMQHNLRSDFMFCPS
jgi:hypothetical protein